MGIDRPNHLSLKLYQFFLSFYSYEPTLTHLDRFNPQVVIAGPKAETVPEQANVEVQPVVEEATIFGNFFCSVSVTS